MSERRVLEVKHDLLARNAQLADAFRAELANRGTFFVDVMASPGAGKTTLLLALAQRLAAHGRMGVIEADLESFVDSEKVRASGVSAVQVRTRGLCHVDLPMVKQAFGEFADEHFEYLFLENIGNLVCPADFDIGAHLRLLLLSVPEGFDKVYKYPGIFMIADALVVTKTDYLPLNPDFDLEALHEQAHALNPSMRFFEVCARTGEGIDDLARHLIKQRARMLG